MAQSGPRPIRVLLIEDDAASAALIAETLERESTPRCEVVVSSRLAEGLQLLDQDSFDSVLVDLQLPDAESLEGLRRIRSCDPAMPVILCNRETDQQLEPTLLGRAVSFSIERKESARLKRSLVYYDNLTGLPNRALLFDRIRHALESARRDGRRLALLYVNIDGFKKMNDSIGHAGGDDLLVILAQRLKSAVRASDTVSRLSGDQFIVLLPRIDSPQRVGTVATRVLAGIKKPLSANGVTLHPTASIGIAMGAGESVTSDSLMRRADAAMQAAKRRGGDNYRFHSSSINNQEAQRILLDRELRQALSNREFRLHFQPLVDLRQGRVGALEALIRWEHPTDGLLLPGSFIPAAEETPLIVAIGEWVIAEACRQALRWREAGLRKVRVAVNLSPHQLTEADTAKLLQERLDEHGLDADALTVEVTETAVLVNEDRAVRSLRDLHEMGIRIALDDFGTGFSSLTHLRKFPIDYVKVDRSFVKEVPDNRESAEIVKAIVGVALGLGKEVVAEGIETTEQLGFLQSLGCETMQGYYFSKPVPESEVPELLEQFWAIRKVRT